MSKEAAKALIERLKTDKAFCDEVMAVENMDDRMAHIRKAGFDCTGEEIRQVQEELGDEELDKVAGGYGTWVL